MNQPNTNNTTNNSIPDDALLGFDVLTSTRSGRSSDFYVEELQAILEEAHDRADEHRNWLESPAGKEEDNREQQLKDTYSRMAKIDCMIGAVKYILTGEVD